MSTAKDQKEQKQQSKKIEDYLKNEKREYQKIAGEPKILILGSSDSGKSTFLKQLKILHGGGFTAEERKIAKNGVLKNILSVIEQLLNNSTDAIKKKYELVTKFISLETGPFMDFPEIIVNLLTTIWNDSNIKTTFISLEQEFPASTSFFFDKLTQISTKSYIMTDSDILLLRTVTQTISDTVFPIQGKNMHFYDVSGLKHHRKSWIPYFQDITAIVFVVALSSYDQMMMEDPTMNRMVDALNLFDFIVNHKLLVNPDMILFLNKTDLFSAKVKTSFIKPHFPDYNQRDGSVSEGSRFFEKKFMGLKKNEKKLMMVHFTCCTDTKAMDAIVSGVIISLVTKAVNSAGMIQ
ncbi:guanine nucleotide binding protein, alpha subunit [Globomyces pollinis-pini]|nr:guanine nucleotide binding protein, alpha subunit [Globomyces pollinis-pini]